MLEATNADDPAGTFGTEVTQGGTGPFILDSYTPDEEATLVRNEDYWGDKALLDQVKAWYADAHSSRKVPLVDLQNLLDKTERRLRT